MEAEYVEDNVALAVQSFLGALNFPFRRFSLEIFSRKKERFLGADARLNGAIETFQPFYMQFKRPSAYPDYSTSRIISDRAALGVGSSPHALFFALRKKRRNQIEFQHNALFELRQGLIAAGTGEAAYVCPLMLDLDSYLAAAHRSGLLHLAAFWRRRPWRLEEVLIRSGGKSVAFERIPLLAEHVTVPPHIRVTSADHQYSFDDSGGQLCFHEPTFLPEGSSNLGSFLTAIVERFLAGEGNLARGDADAVLLNLMERAYGEGGSLEVLGTDPIGRWQEFGYRLNRDFGIVQYAFTRWKRAPFDYD